MLWSSLYSLLKRMVYTVGKVDWFSLALVSGQGAFPSYYSFHILERTLALLNLVASHKSLAFFFLLSSGYFSIAVPLIYYGLQHYLSLAGSLIFIPLIIVPAMGGTDVSMCFPAFIFVLQFKWVTHYIHCINDHRRILPL